MELFAHKINFLECFAVVLKSARVFRHQQGREWGEDCVNRLFLYFVFCILYFAVARVFRHQQGRDGGRIALTGLF